MASDRHWANLEGVGAAAAVCTRCPMLLGRRHVVFGVGNPGADLMVVGEAPGIEEDAAGEPFAGPTRSWLGSRLAEVGLSRNDVYLTNIVKCHPPGSPPEPNREPRAGEIRNCAEYLDAQAAFVRPRVILAVGALAGAALLGRKTAVSAARGRAWPRGRWAVVVTWHPSGVRYGHDRTAQIRGDFRLAADLLAAGDGRPSSVR